MSALRARVVTHGLADKVLILSEGARRVTPRAEATLRREFKDHLIIPFEPGRDIERLMTADAVVVVAGGDGTVGHVVGKLLSTNHVLGIIGVGTFNNFARALGLPRSLRGAIRAVREGRPVPISVGSVNGHVFLEAAAVGLFGKAIRLGEVAKDHALGQLATELKRVVSSRPFDYELSGDLEGSGRAMSLVVANTPSTGANLDVGRSDPTDSHLDLSIGVGESRTDVVGRLVAASVRRRPQPDQVFHFRRLEVRTRPRTQVYADNRPAGRTPAVITAEVSALRILLPRTG